MAYTLPENPTEDQVVEITPGRKLIYQNGKWSSFSNNTAPSNFVIEWDSIINGPSVTGSEVDASVGKTTTWSGLTYDIAFSTYGKPDASEVIHRFVACRPYVIPMDQTNGRAVANVQATAETVFVIAKNGTSIGTITFATGATLGVISIPETTFAVGDKLTLTAPATQDTTLSDLAVTLLATL